MHPIANEIRNCKNKCFHNRYQNFTGLTKEQFCQIKPLAYSPDKPTILLISQSPSLQAWKNSYGNDDEDGGMTSKKNLFLIHDLLPAFGLTSETIDIFRKKVFWVHSCNCYSWFKNNPKKNIRYDIKPSKKEVNNCLGRWKNSLFSVKSIKYIILMGGVATKLVPQLKSNKNETFTSLVKRKRERNDIINGKIILPIFHQSKKNMLFNENENKVINNKIKIILNSWINE